MGKNQNSTSPSSIDPVPNPRKIVNRPLHNPRYICIYIYIYSIESAEESRCKYREILSLSKTARDVAMSNWYALRSPNNTTIYMDLVDSPELFIPPALLSPSLFDIDLECVTFRLLSIGLWTFLSYLYHP